MRYFRPTKTKCNRKLFAKRMREARTAQKQIPADLRPLFKHLLHLAQDSLRNGACKRAGREIHMAKRLIRYAK